MNQHETSTGLRRNASAAVIAPIAGLLGGVIVGTIRAKLGGLIDLAELMCVIKWAVTGMFGGLGLVLLIAFAPRRGDVLSIRRLMVLIAVIGIAIWFVDRIFLGAIGAGGF